MSRKKSKKGMFGLGEDTVQMGMGIAIAGGLSMVINKTYHKKDHHPHSPNDGGLLPNDQSNSGGGGRVSDYIGELSARMGAPKVAIVKGGAAIALLYASEKMPQYGGALKFAAGVLAWDALTSQHKIRSFMGIHDAVSGTEQMNAIEDELRAEIKGYQDAIYGTTLADHMDGTTLAGTELAEQFQMNGPDEIHGGGDYGMHATNQFSALGL